jgi:hypothetical protein
MITISSIVTGPKARLGARYMNIGDGAEGQSHFARGRKLILPTLHTGKPDIAATQT